MNNLNNVNLYPCPFCGSVDLCMHEQTSNDKTVTWYHLHHGPYNPCGVTIRDTDKEKLFERWNNRVDIKIADASSSVVSYDIYYLKKEIEELKQVISRIDIEIQTVKYKL